MEASRTVGLGPTLQQEQHKVGAEFDVQRRVHKLEIGEENRGGWVVKDNHYQG